MSFCPFVQVMIFSYFILFIAADFLKSYSSFISRSLLSFLACPPLYRFPVFLKTLFCITPSLTASSPVDTSFSLSGSSTPSVLPSSSSSSSTSSSTKPHSVEAREAEVRLLPPLLKDQAWGVHAHEAFLLFCLALGEWCLWRWIGLHPPNKPKPPCLEIL